MNWEFLYLLYQHFAPGVIILILGVQHFRISDIREQLKLINQVFFRPQQAAKYEARLEKERERIRANA